MLDERLREIIRQDSRLMTILQAAREVNLPEWYIGAGVIRNTVWDHLHGYPGKSLMRDIDLAYFDGRDLSDRLGKEAELVLSKLVPDVEWDVVNQAGVHLWYKNSFGHEVEPLHSCEGGIDTWPETATCVAVRLLEDGMIQIYAPYGLDDLFNIVLRRNPVRVSEERFRERYLNKRIKEKWPNVTIIDEGEGHIDD